MRPTGAGARACGEGAAAFTGSAKLKAARHGRGGKLSAGTNANFHLAEHLGRYILMTLLVLTDCDYPYSSL